MQISITDPTHQTLLFGIGLGLIFLLTFVKKRGYTSLDLTQELKGFAILAIIFAHIGYALTIGGQFLFPFSVLAGVGVDLFLFFSGYGLAYSAAKRPETRASFYTRRLPRLFIPFWVVVSTLFLLDYFFTGGSYSWAYIAQSFAGVFTNADLYHTLNSPLWYFTFILFYYLLFPLVFFKRHIWITAFILFAVVYAIVHIDFWFLKGVVGLYQVHMLGFPLGVLAAWYVRSDFSPHRHIHNIYKRVEWYVYPLLIGALGIAIGYLALNGNVGKAAYIAQATSLLTSSLVIILFALKKRKSKLFTLFGLYSYEIYLFHWPLLYRYDIIYAHLPAWLATLLYLGVFIGIAYAVKKVVEKI